MKLTTRHIILLIILVILLLPMIQALFPFSDEKPLNGAIEIKQKPEFSYKNWFDGSYQTNYESYLEENIGFRNFFVRLNNQIYYTFFDIAKASGVIVGKDNYLYERNYIDGYLGRNFKGKDFIDDKLNKLNFIKDKLKSKGIDLVVVFNPGKASFFPEYIPDDFHPENKTMSNYDYYTSKCKELSIPMIDFNAWFISQKEKSQYPLYPKCGIHWSNYGMMLCMDSLVHYIEKKRNIDLPDIIVDSVVVLKKLWDTDYDIGDGMNLLFEINHPKMAYPKYHIVSNGKTKPKVLTIADSFYWNIYGAGFGSAIFSYGGFWYYFHEVYPSKTEGQTTTIDQINVLSELEKNDVVVLMTAEGTLHKFAYGFIDKVYDLYNGSIAADSAAYEAKINKYKTDMLNNPDWMKDITEKAKKKNITIEEEMRNHAIWMIEHEKNNN